MEDHRLAVSYYFQFLYTAKILIFTTQLRAVLIFSCKSHKKIIIRRLLILNIIEVE